MNFNLFGPQQQGLQMPQRPSTGLQMPSQMPMGVVPNQQGFQIPTGLADQMNAPLQKYAQPSAGISPMAMMQLMNMGMKMGDQNQQPMLPPAYRAPMPELSPYQPREYHMFSNRR